MTKKSLETLTDKELMELASSKYNIFETVDQKPFRNVTDRKITWLDCPGEITVGELERKNKRKLEELKELERLQRKYSKSK